MKKKIICVILCIIVLVITMIANSIDISKRKRYHQHIEYTKQVKTDDTDEFNTHLPIVSIDTNGLDIPAERVAGLTADANISIYDNTEKNNYLTDEPQLRTLATIKARGNSSLHFDKKGYLLKFINDDRTENHQEVLGMSKYNEWILNGPFLDKTLIRNYLCFNISGEIMEYAPNVRFCELFLNNEYRGVYVLLESISRSDLGRINISKYNQKNNYTSYILRVDRGSRNDIQNLNSFLKYTNSIDDKAYADIIYPSSKKINEKIKKYIERDLSKFEKSLYSFDYKEYSKFIDVNSFIDYFIINEFFQNYDAGSYSTYLYKDARGKLKMCVWDFNNCCDNYIEISTQEKDFMLQNKLYFSMLLKDRGFNTKVIKRYRELRNNILNEKYLINYIEETRKYLGDAVGRNFSLWGYTFEEEYDLLPEERKISSYTQAINQLENFIINRGNWLDNHIEEIYQFSHESQNKKYNR